MGAPNALPASQGGMAAPHEHTPFEDGKPSGSDRAMLGQGIAPHGTPAPVGNGKVNPIH